MKDCVYSTFCGSTSLQGGVMPVLLHDGCCFGLYSWTVLSGCWYVCVGLRGELHMCWYCAVWGTAVELCCAVLCKVLLSNCMRASTVLCMLLWSCSLPCRIVYMLGLLLQGCVEGCRAICVWVSRGVWCYSVVTCQCCVVLCVCVLCCVCCNI